MYRFTAAAALACFFGSAYADDASLKDASDRESYSLGYQIGSNFKRQAIEVKPDVFTKAIQDALSDAPAALSKEDMEKSLTSLQQRVGAAQQQQRKETAEKNLAAGKTFLDDNAKKEGVVVLPSGLQYKITAEGNGSKPQATDTVTVHYRGTLIDGTEFDSSFSRGQPAKFKLGQVIKGWTEGLQLLKQGTKAQLFIPPTLAYGERGAGPIGPNSTLIFDIELIGIEPTGKDGEPEKPVKKGSSKKK